MEEEKKVSGTSLTPNEKHFYWQEICRHEDLTRDNFKIKDNIDIYNADKSRSLNKAKLEKFNNNLGRMLIVPTHTTAKVRPSQSGKGSTDDTNEIRKYYMKSNLLYCSYLTL